MAVKRAHNSDQTYILIKLLYLRKSNKKYHLKMLSKACIGIKRPIFYYSLYNCRQNNHNPSFKQQFRRHFSLLSSASLIHINATTSDNDYIKRNYHNSQAHAQQQVLLLKPYLFHSFYAKDFLLFLPKKVRFTKKILIKL
jgi:hypothetical protein